MQQQLTMAMDTPIQPQMHTAGPPYVSPVPKDAAWGQGTQQCIQSIGCCDKAMAAWHAASY